jgi:hypothetical protein
MPADTVWETIKAQGGQLVDELRRLLREGNVRRIVVRRRDAVVAEFPLNVGLVGALAAPVLAAVGALVAVLADCSIDVERTGGAQPGRPRAPRRPARPASRKRPANAARRKPRS